MGMIQIRYTAAVPPPWPGLINVIAEQLFDSSIMEVLPGPPILLRRRSPPRMILITFRQGPHVGLQAIIAGSDRDEEAMEVLSPDGVDPLSRNVPTVGLQAIMFRQGPHVGFQAIIAGSDRDEETMEVLPWSPRTRIVNMLFGGQTAPQAITFRRGPHVGLQAIIVGRDLDEEAMKVLPWSPRTRIVNILFGGQTAPEEAYE